MNRENPMVPEESKKSGKNFIEVIIEEELAAGKNGGRIHTRFPPEPNGYLHIGHAKAICLDFGIAAIYGGKCNLRFDDTNPIKEDIEYVDAIKADIKWLGFDWEEREFYASDYFDKLYAFACKLIEQGLAYVDDQKSEDIAKQKGTPTESGVHSPFRNRPPHENLDLFHRMNTGEFPEGSRVLRAKIDMSSSNMHMRDPIIYRILFTPHHRTGSDWKVYPMYDFAHGQSDYFEGITHSLCTLEFIPHRELYDWFIDQLKSDDYRPRQIEFNRLNLTYTVMSKRKLLQLVKDQVVDGWSDPRMPTLSGLRRRGYTPESIKAFVDKIGYTKYLALNDIGLLESSVRDHLNKTADRVMAVLNPIKLIITNYPEGKEETLPTINNPENPESENHDLFFGREIFIEREDFMEEPPKKFFRLAPNAEVRLKSAYIIKCTGFKKNPESGEIEEIYCTYDPETKSGTGIQRKVKGTLHWVSTNHAVDAEVRLYDRLFLDSNPDGHKDREFTEFLNPDSLKIIPHAKVEPYLMEVDHTAKFQFTRLGYFSQDPVLSNPGKPVFNRVVSLKDSWEKSNKE